MPDPGRRAVAKKRAATTTIVGNLQALIDGKCISASGATKLTLAQRNAIEDLGRPEIRLLLEMRRAIGRVPGGVFII